jgi:hypothetical protein
MRHVFASCLVVTALSFSVPASADDRADCTAGIAMIRAELNKQPPQATQTALQRALRSAERELNGGGVLRVPRRGRGRQEGPASLTSAAPRRPERKAP